jgi:phosphatidylinositol-4-phosphate 3-kinase
MHSTKHDTKMLPSRSRHNKSDLIDLSNDDDDKSCNNILDLFDPLNNINTNAQQNSSKRDVTRSNTSARSMAKPIELSCRGRRLRATSACSMKTRNMTDINLSFKVPPNPTEQIYITGDGSIISRCSTNLTPPSSKSESSSSDRHLDTELDRLSIRSSRSSNDIPALERNDLNSRKSIDSNNADDSNNKLRLARKLQRSGREVVLLTEKIKSFRAKFKHHDRKTNSGIVYSPTLYSCIKVLDMSVKLIITSPMATEPISFTCNVSTSVEHLISHAVCSMFENLKEDDSMDNYILKVTGKDEYFDSNLCLADYALVTHCWKFDLDVRLTLVRLDSIKRTYERTSKDDFRCKSLLCADDLLSRTAILKYSDLNYEALNITIETFEREAQRLYSDVTNKSTTLQTQSLLQTTKAICSLMMNCETSQLSDSKNNLAELCRSYKSEGEQLADEDRYKMIEVIQHAIKRLVENMRRLLRVTSLYLPVDYEVIDGTTTLADTISRQRRSFVDSPIEMIRDHVSLRVHLVSQLKPDWLAKYQEFHLTVGLAYGDRELCDEVMSTKIRADKSFFQRLLFDEDIVLPITYSSLPREARFNITLCGTETLPVVGNPGGNYLNVGDDPSPLRRTGSSTSICSTAPMYSSSPKSSIGGQKQLFEHVQHVLAKAIAYVFDHENILYQGDRLVYLHPTSDALDGHLYVETIADRNDPILVLEHKTFPPEKKIYFPDVSVYKTTGTKASKNFDDLDAGVRYVLKSIIFEKPSHERLMDDEKALLWDNREYLTSIPSALSKVLISAPSWSPANLRLIYAALELWKPLEAIDALQLLLPSFPDTLVRKYAVDWISQQHDDELCDYLPQLLQAFRYEKSIDCPLFWLLLERALKNIRIANSLYWQLKISSSDKMIEERSETLINCLLWTCGSAFWKFIDKQNELLSKLTVVSNDIKKVRDSQRLSILYKKLEQIQDYLMEKKPAMPWAPSLEICDLDIGSCSYFPSNALPLKLAFRSCEESCNRQIKFYNYDTIFKMGDDLRQDMLAIQIIRIMEKLWLREGLDLRMVTFDCLATGERQGMIEVVQNAETLRKIQQKGCFLTGPFNPKAIDDYIRLWNTSELEYKTALDNFLHSCAGYSVATYVLGICDRHNDNIMITNSGHLFHIDFGKFLGDSQMLGSIKRDRTPFVLTADMAYVINGGDRPTKKFQTFIELCTMGFNIIRRHRNLFLNLFSLMSSAKIHGLDRESVRYIDKMLMPNLTEAEAMAKFTRLIDECLNSRSTQVNFFIHNLAQLRFSNDNSKQTLLSFVPKTFTMQTDGKIESLDVVRLYKLYEPEKQYYYVVRVKRYNQPDATEITRTFREFSELQMKLNCMFPSSNFHDINKSTSSFLMDFVGRNNTREIAERRLVELKTFLRKLLLLPPEISQCDLIYTFFHPILRDQSTNNGDMSSINVSSSSSTFGSQEYTEAQRTALYRDAMGQVKLRLSYKNSTLIIMMMHAKNLPQIYGESSPNCYAKTYLLPDPHKQTKRKTRVVRQNCNPSFMELIVYNIPLESLKRLTLQVSIWHSEMVQNKVFVGAAYIPLGDVDLSKETTSWYPLKGY